MINKEVVKCLKIEDVGTIKLSYSKEHSVDTVHNKFGEQQNRLQYKVSVRFNGNTNSFKFYGSINDFKSDKKMASKDLPFVLYCAVGDALSYLDYNLDEFAESFGYKKPSECIKAYKNCKKSLNKLKKLGISEDDLYKIAEWLQDNNYC